MTVYRRATGHVWSIPFFPSRGACWNAAWTICQEPVVVHHPTTRPLVCTGSRTTGGAHWIVKGSSRWPAMTVTQKARREESSSSLREEWPTRTHRPPLKVTPGWGRSPSRRLATPRAFGCRTPTTTAASALPAPSVVARPVEKPSPWTHAQFSSLGVSGGWTVRCLSLPRGPACAARMVALWS